MSAREAQPITGLDAILVDQRLDDRAVQILTDGRQHAPAAMKWALGRNPYMASFTAKELALGSYEVHRS